MRGEIPRGETWLTTPGQMRRGARRQRLIFGPCPTKAGPMMNIAIMARNVVGASLLLATAAALGGCDAAPAPDSRPPLEGARIGGPFTLTAQNGRTVRDSDFAGKYRLVYFGYSFKSEERRVGKECVSTCRSGLSQDH